MSAAPSMEDDLRSDIQPVCPRDNSVMVYQATYLAKTDLFHPGVIEGFLPSYGCAEPGCDARFRHTQGYFTLQGAPESPTMVPIAEVNIAKCPEHCYRLYMRARSGSEKDIAWCCAVRGCEHVQRSSDIPGSWAR
jgi:hypothetical protein